MDFRLTPLQEDIKKAAREFAEKEFPLYAQRCDQEETVPFEVLKKARELGFVGIFVPERYGGMGLGYLETALVMEEFWRMDPGIGSQIMCQCFGCEMLCLFGSEEQKEKYLRGVCEGGLISAVAVTEPDCGSDVLSVSTLAIKEGKGYRVNGRKMFISNGTIADFFVTFCLTNPEASSPKKRHSVLIIDSHLPGVQRNKLRGKLGIRAHDTAEVIFDNVWIPQENLIGEEGEGFRYFMEFFNRSRAYVAAQGVGIAQGALEMAIKHVKQRKAFGRLLCEFQMVQERLAEMATFTEAARNLVYKAAWKIDQGEIDVALISMAKWFAGEVGVKVVNEALQLHGGYGYFEDYPVSRFYRDAKIVEIYEGTKEIEKLIIARQLLKRGF
uniref:Acyl-CoA dehydrogenase n=1 Tax=candidate division WOR-3 bacterium TaxID=2052148 RepID=A0A7C2PJX6_UNCW3